MTLAQQLTGLRNQMDRNGVPSNSTVDGVNAFIERVRVVLSPESINGPRVSGIQVGCGTKGQVPMVLIRAL
jgi:hypothetical protein